MKNSIVFGAVTLSAFLGAGLFACSSSSSSPTGGGGGTDAGTSDAGVSTDTDASGGGVDSGISYGSWGAPCNNPVNSGGGGGGGGAAVDGGGIDPACTGTYDLCASIGQVKQCTKACAYPAGGSGPAASPDCPNPPTNGMCTPRGFCQ